MYPPELVAPMKSDLTEAGFSELISEADVDAALAKEGTTLVVLNSVCGCAAGSMRPGVKLAVQHSKVPTNLTTAFAGVDREGRRPRPQIHAPLPSFFALRGSVQGRSFGGAMVERHHIEGRTAEDDADHLKMAFDEFC